MTSRDCEIVDSDAFCEVIFVSISPKNLLGDFFDSLAIILSFLNSKQLLYAGHLCNGMEIERTKPFSFASSIRMIPVGVLLNTQLHS
jgi:hypothetical protein